MKKLKFTIKSMLCATGTMIVGDASGNNNAGVTGVVEATPGNSVRFWAGAPYANRNTAPFRVQQDGKVYMTNAVVQGSLNAGEVGGMTIANGVISKFSGTSTTESEMIINAVGDLYIYLQSRRLVGQSMLTRGYVKLGDYYIEVTELSPTRIMGQTAIEAQIGRKVATVSSSYSMSNNDFCVVATAGLTVYFPPLPSDGQEIQIMKATAATVVINGNGKLIRYRDDGGASSRNLEWSMRFIYAAGAWRLMAYF